MIKNRVICFLPGAFVLLLFYSTYIQFHHHTSWTLIFPLLVAGIIARNQYQYRIFKKTCLAKCFLQPGTWPARIMQKRVFSLLLSVMLSVVYAVSLMSFIALGSWPAIWYLFINFGLIAVFYAIIYPGVKRWISSEIADVLAAKMIALLCFFVMVPIYLWTAFNTPIPEYVDPESLSRTIAGASSQVASLCPVTNFYLKAVQELNAIFYYYSTTASLNMKLNWMKFLIWLLFFIKSSLVFLAMSRFNVEVMTMVLKLWSEHQANKKENQAAKQTESTAQTSQKGQET